MKLTFLIFILFTCNFAFCQNQLASNSATDISLVKQSFLKLISALEHDDIRSLEAISYAKISCDYCAKRDLSVKTLLNVELKDFKETKIYTAYINRGISIGEENFTTPNNLPVYVVWVEMLLPNEYAKGHEGASFGFQFSIENGEYKFYGLTSVP